MQKTPDIIVEASRELRKNMTNAERFLWKQLKERKISHRFLRQKPIFLFSENNGFNRYIIPDFYCSEKKLCIEIDGGIHLRKEIYALDRFKEDILVQQGYTIIRFTNDEVFGNISGVIEEIEKHFQ